MNTKTVRLDDDTRRIMRSCSIKQAGNEWTLDLPQLERKDYDKAKKAINALGCVWARGRGTHVCREDPTEAITGISNGDNIEVAQYDFFPTPMPLVWRMTQLADIQANDVVLEPSAGDGRIAEYVRQSTPQPSSITVCEINPEARAVLARQHNRLATEPDFLKYYPAERYTKVLMNPPFSKEQDILHVQHAWDLLTSGGRIVTIMSEHAFFANNLRCTQFREWLDNVGWSEELPEGTFKESGTMVRARLVVIDKPSEATKTDTWEQGRLL